VIQVHQIINDQSAVVHLCQQCAIEQGIEVEATLESNPLTGFLALLDQHPATAGACPGCGATLEDYRSTGRLGCALCYATFAGPLRDLLRRIHGAAVHTGSRPPSAEDSLTAEARRADLQSQLLRAIEHEQFERAAVLRDQLREFE
jgi:protein arginine kinase activator